MIDEYDSEPPAFTLSLKRWAGVKNWQYLPFRGLIPPIAQSSDVTNEIVTTVAAYEEASPDELPPLAEKIDSETYRQLVAPERNLTEPLSFEYLWYQVTVLPDGEVVVTP